MSDTLQSSAAVEEVQEAENASFVLQAEPILRVPIAQELPKYIITQPIANPEHRMHLTGKRGDVLDLGIRCDACTAENKDACPHSLAAQVDWRRMRQDEIMKTPSLFQRQDQYFRKECWVTASSPTRPSLTARRCWVLPWRM
jgi:hypothetical protein